MTNLYIVTIYNTSYEDRKFILTDQIFDKIFIYMEVYSFYT